MNTITEATRTDADALAEAEILDRAYDLLGDDALESARADVAALERTIAQYDESDAKTLRDDGVGRYGLAVLDRLRNQYRALYAARARVAWLKCRSVGGEPSHQILIPDRQADADVMRRLLSIATHVIPRMVALVGEVRDSYRRSRGRSSSEGMGKGQTFATGQDGDQAIGLAWFVHHAMPLKVREMEAEREALTLESALDDFKSTLASEVDDIFTVPDDIARGIKEARQITGTFPSGDRDDTHADAIRSLESQIARLDPGSMRDRLTKERDDLIDDARRRNVMAREAAIVGIDDLVRDARNGDVAAWWAIAEIARQTPAAFDPDFHDALIGAAHTALADADPTVIMDTLAVTITDRHNQSDPFGITPQPRDRILQGVGLIF